MITSMLRAATLATSAFAALPAMADATAATRYTTPLADVCPSPFYIQKDWLAQAEHGGLYQLIGTDGKMETGRYTGPLGATGIELVILEGGGNVGLGDGETAYSALFNGNSRAGVVPHLGFQELDNAFIFSKRFPVTGVFTNLDGVPSGLFWDVGTYPDGFRSVEDLKAFAASGKGKIYVSSISRTFGLYLVNSGVPKDAFLEGYRGDGEVFLTNNGTWLNQGFVTTEVFKFTHGSNWGRPVEGITVRELGYPTYTGMLAVANHRMDELAPCLEKLVPLLQQAQIDYIKAPGPVNQLIADFNEAGHAASWWKTTVELNNHSSKVQLERGIVGNGHNDTLGDFDMDQVRAMHALVKPWLDERGNPDVKPEDVVTNRFIDPSIRLE